MRQTAHARFVLSLILAAAATRLFAAPLEDARRELLAGRVASAIALLKPLASVDTPGAHLLLCRAYLAESDLDDASDQCAAATSAPGAGSDAFLWYGRVLGHRASHSNPVTAFALARQTRTAFEHAIALDAGNLPAVADLGEFYVEAPAIVGGSADRARSLAAAVAPRSARSSRQLLGRIAAKAGDQAEAAAQFRAAIAAATPVERPSAWIDLAQFFQSVHKDDDAVDAIRKAISLDHDHGPVLVDAAHLLTQMHREPGLAIRLLQQYLESPARTDEAPSFKARLQLARLLEAQGDSAGAARQRDLASSEAPDFHPARHGDADDAQVP